VPWFFYDSDYIDRDLDTELELLTMTNALTMVKMPEIDWFYFTCASYLWCLLNSRLRLQTSWSSCSVDHIVGRDTTAQVILYFCILLENSMPIRIINGFRYLREAVKLAPEVWTAMLIPMAAKPGVHNFTFDIISALVRHFSHKLPETSRVCISRYLHKLVKNWSPDHLIHQ
jgi:hypothetical protein